MLGIRHINGVALDFWVGAPRFFSCDKSFVFKGDFEKFSEFIPQTEVKEENLMKNSEISDFSEIILGEGHVAFSPNTGCTPKELFDFIESKVLNTHKGRVTVIFPTIEIHDPFFEELGKRFPEEL